MREIFLVVLLLCWAPTAAAELVVADSEELEELVVADSEELEELGYEPEEGEEEAPSIDGEYETEVRARRPPRAASEYRIDTAEVPAQIRSRISSLLRLAPGLHLSQHSGEGKADQLFLRGFDAIHGQDIEVIVAGIPVNELSNVHGQGYADLHFVIPELVSRMRVVEGTYDPRQGDFAVAGSLVLDLGLRERGITIRGDYGSFDTWRTMIAWGPRGQPDETFVAVDYEAGDGHGPARSWNRVRAIGQALIDLPRDFSLRLFASSYAGRFSSAGVVRLDDFEEGRMGFFDSYDPHQGGFSSRHQGLAEVRYEGDDDRASLSIYGGYRDLRLRHDFTGFTLESPSGENSLADRPGDLAEQLHQFSEIGFTGTYRRLNLPVDWVRFVELGVIVRHDRIDQTQRRLQRVDRAPWTEEISADLSLTEVGAYLDIELRPWSWLAARGGVRLDAFSALIHDRQGFDGEGGRRDALGLQASPRVTIEAIPAPWLAIFGSYGRGFRSPQALSLGDGERAPLTTVDSGELGLALTGERAGELRLAGFVTYVEEDLIFDHVTGRNIDTGETLRGGVALSLSLELTDWARVSGNLTWTKASYASTGEVVPFIAPVVARMDLVLGGVVARFWRRELRLQGGLHASIVGPRPLPYDERSQSVVLIDVSASARLGEVELGIGVLNLLDRRWRDGEFAYVSSFDEDVADPSLIPARHFTAGYPLRVSAYLALHL